ncbi:hypothetical protein [Mycolicibacterium sphagni]|uniref:hypothetical protein n=1 Tax=Mycolicibacterium sphagni TaxID=1786 RepID=UPI0021F2629B|nr:hypothetical protein [Mycolicibacterium sphagni]MCV7175093.1 hypothetical protein [Mycolicibacterium sphagni]
MPTFNYESTIELGLRYRDSDTAFTGVADQVLFRRNACPMVRLTTLVNSVPSQQWFDEPNVTLVGDVGAGFSL